jgi:hypothetical protein
MLVTPSHNLGTNCNKELRKYKLTLLPVSTCKSRYEAQVSVWYNHVVLHIQDIYFSAKCQNSLLAAVMSPVLMSDTVGHVNSISEPTKRDKRCVYICIYIYIYAVAQQPKSGLAHLFFEVFISHIHTHTYMVGLL